ncbi:MAG: hypothetical protein AB9873_17395 [Syntrophobacteraceae bacterium]
METYCDAKDLSRLQETGNDAPKLAKKFFEYCGALFAEGEM